MIISYILMNAFYQRLQNFGALIHQAADTRELPLADYFQVVHPSYPVVSRTRSVIPQLEFEDRCPVKERRMIRKMLRRAFSRAA